MAKTVFAWLPVRLSRFNGHHWEYTGKVAWLRRVRRITTVWADTFYFDLETPQ